MVLGKKSGKDSIRVKLEEFHLELDEDKFPALLQDIKNLSIRERRYLTDQEFLELYDRVK